MTLLTRRTFAVTLLACIAAGVVAALVVGWVDHVGLVDAPILIIGGAVDRHTTEADTRVLYDAAREPKRLWLIPGAGHVDYFDVAGEEYRNRVLDFIAAAFAARHASR